MEAQNPEKLGLTKGEIKIYFALLELGECTRTQLARKSGVSPSKIYDVSNRLIGKGIISSVRKNGVAHFSPANPESLRDFIEAKEKELSKEKQVVEHLMPLLMQKYRNKEEKIDIEVFYGWKGMKTVYDDIIKSLSKNDINFVFGASRGEDKKQADIFFMQHFRKIDRKGFRIKIIFNEDLRNDKERVGYYHKPHEIRYLHNDTFTEINMYNNNVLFVMLLKRPIIIRVKNKEAADSFRKFFETMWKQAKR